MMAPALTLMVLPYHNLWYPINPHRSAMHLVTVSAHYPAPSDAVWRVVGDFGGLRAWSRSVQECILEGAGVGSHRVIVTAAGRIRERLDEWDAVAQRLSYTPVSGSSLPVRDLRATIAVMALPQSTRVDWTIEGEPVGDAAEVAALLQARYAARLEELRGAIAKAQAD